MLIPRFRQSGVTLIEVVTTLSVVAILAALAVPSFKTVIFNRKISASAESVLSGLQLARAEAVRRNTLVQFTLNDDSTWTVSCVSDTACSTIQSSTIGDGANSEVTISANPSGADSVVYNSFGATITIPGLTPLTQLDFDLPTSILSAAETHELRVVINSGGAARLCDPHYSSPDARAC
jgi:type IV fimbrial biogenesis protein FimT